MSNQSQSQNPTVTPVETQPEPSDRTVVALLPPGTSDLDHYGFSAIPFNNELHVVPLGDLHLHVLSGRCWCRPVLEEDEDHESSNWDSAWLHNAADGRTDERH